MDGSVNTVKSYADDMEDSFLVFTTTRFSYSLKQQFVSPKKVYCIDNGLAEAVAFAFTKNKGRYLENLAFLELKRRHEEIYYYKMAVLDSSSADLPVPPEGDRGTHTLIELSHCN